MGGHILKNAALAEKVVLIDPVEHGEAAKGQAGTNRYERRIEESKPNPLDNFRVSLTDAVVGILHQPVGLLLCAEVGVLIAGAFESVADMPGVEQPYEGSEEGIEEEHDGLLLDDSILVRVDVVELDVLDQQRHDGGGEEQSQHVLEGEGELVVAARLLLLVACQSLRDRRQDEFVEQQDQQQTAVH